MRRARIVITLDMPEAVLPGVVTLLGRAVTGLVPFGITMTWAREA